MYVTLTVGPIVNVQYLHGASVHHTGEHSLRSSLLFTSGQSVCRGPWSVFVPEKWEALVNPMRQRRGRSFEAGGAGPPRRLVIRTGHIENILQAITTRYAFHMPCHLILSKTLGDKCYLETRIREVK